jgi:TetR/AcrR family transcriptional repressor of nem operon
MAVMSLPARPAHDSRTRLLDASLQVIRSKGYAATTVEDICRAAGLTKGSFFHHFKGKDALALEAVRHWNDTTGALFAGAAYQRLADPRERLLAYIDLRAALIRGEPADFTCLLGTLVQETYATHPALRKACEAGIRAHAATVARIAAEAKARYAPKAAWQPEGLALYTQAALQGAFILAKAGGGPAIATQCIEHLKRYVTLLLGDRPAAPARRRPPPAPSRPTRSTPRTKGKP